MPEPKAAPAAPTTEPPPIVTTPSVPTPPREPDPGPESTAAEPLELQVGTYWMSRIGMGILLTGLVFLGNYAYHQLIGLLGPGGKLSLLALVGAAMAAGGLKLEQARESMRNLGRVFLGGGAAVIYYAGYAAHFITGLRVIESPIVGGLLLLLIAGGIVWFAERRKAQAVATIAVLLSYYTSAINPIGLFTLWSNLVLTSVAVWFLIRHSWTRLTTLGLFATYGSYGYWRLHHVVQQGYTGVFAAGLGFLGCYWVLFTVAAFLIRSRAGRNAPGVSFMALNNAAYFSYATLHFLLHRHADFWAFTTCFGLVQLGLAVIAGRRRDEWGAMEPVYLGQGLLLLTLGVVLRFTGPSLVLMLLVESSALLICSRWRYRALYEVAAALCALVAAALALQATLWSRPSSLTIEVVAALLLLGNAALTKFLHPSRRSEAFVPTAFFHALLGLGLGGALVWRSCPPAWQPVACASLALLAFPAARFRLLEIAVPVHCFAVLGSVAIIDQSQSGSLGSGWSLLAVSAVSVGFVHAWRAVAAKWDPSAAVLAELVHAGSTAAATLVWLHGVCGAPGWVLVTGALAVVTLGYGLITRLWSVALIGQVFTAGCVITSLQNAGDISQWSALTPVVVVAITAFLLHLYGAYRWPQLGSAEQFAGLAELYRWVASALLGVWGFMHLSWSARPAFYLLTGAAAIFWRLLAGGRPQIGLGPIYAGLGLLMLVLHPTASYTLAQSGSVLALAAVLHFGARKQPELAHYYRWGLGVVLAAAWLCVSRATISEGHGAQLTLVWALFGGVLMAVGLALRERVDRITGLSIIALGLVRLFFVDVWQFDTLYRILVFITLGSVLLALSFIYHRFAETLKTWL